MSKRASRSFSLWLHQPDSPTGQPAASSRTHQGHWAIENKLHYRRDVTLREDACQVRKGQAPRTLAILNSFLLALFDWLEVANVASQMRVFAAQPLLALRLFMLPLASMK